MTESNESNRNYTFGINVESAGELDAISVKVRDFIRMVGEGPCDIQVAINPALAEESAEYHGEQTPAIGFVYEGGAEDYEEEIEDEYEGEDD